ncbi:Mor transcription activator family protein [Sideroxydans lithotrophicus]|uniref:Mor transcription activator domain-containing protein n=1 Tax=Sideroxydans lithotrophicus (strain ES-1) TaxID=580332 RepID=D5CUC0_SIDLE|nr:Mor transcription activator family protein [Sideroxydans lithotrophicus]ADE10455.1 conserved hypothetical protein [Sideroxydans lithotrophicus ES-1]
MNLTDDDLHLLPTSMQWLAKTIGLPAVLAMVKTHGGLAPVYVPVKVTPDHYLNRLIGIQAFTDLVAEYGGDTIEIAKCERAVKDLLYRQIRKEILDTTQEVLASRYGYTVRHIRNIVGDVVDDRQAGLF